MSCRPERCWSPSSDFGRQRPNPKGRTAPHDKRTTRRWPLCPVVSTQLLIYEEGGGWWNRFDAEYSFSDQLVAFGEVNLYWGDSEGTMFGQFENSSNLQLGMKYIIE